MLIPKTQRHDQVNSAFARRAVLNSAVLALFLGAASAALAASPSFEVIPLVSRADEPVEIRATGLQPGGTATISATTRDGSGHSWQSRVTCMADRTGVIDLERCEPISGAGASAPASTYSTTDGMGLFWSMQQQNGAATFFQFPDAPSAVYELALTVRGAAVQRTLIERQLMSENVVRIPLTKSADGIVGTAFEPTATATKPDEPQQSPESEAGVKHYPAVLLLSGSGGGHQLDTLAGLLASHGYETLSLAYYTGYSDADGLPPDLLSIPVETVGKALTWLKKRPSVDDSKIAIIGHSRGSELALLSAADFPEIKAAVVLAGSPVVWPGINSQDYTHDFPAWTFHDKPIPFLPSASYFARANQEQRPLIIAFEQGLDNTAAANAAFIPLERIRGPVLFLGGDADALWPSKRMAEMAITYLRRNHHPFNDQMEMFTDAGHWFFEPYFPVENRITWARYDMKFGGTAPGDARAAPQAWARIIEFLDKSIAGRAH